VITASKSNALGYSHAFCIKCSNSAQTETVDNWIVSLKICVPGISVSKFYSIQTAAAFSSSAGSFKFEQFTEGCMKEIVYHIGSKTKAGVIP
jgi:hypothetical protein